MSGYESSNLITDASDALGVASASNVPSASWLPQWLIDLSSIASILGLLISIFLLWEAWKIRKLFALKARLPEVVEEASKMYDQFYSSLKNFNTDKQAVHDCMKKSEGILEVCLKKIDDKDVKKKINGILSLISKIKLGDSAEDEYWKVYSDFSSLLTVLRQNEKDIKWR